MKGSKCKLVHGQISEKAANLGPYGIGGGKRNFEFPNFAKEENLQPPRELKGSGCTNNSDVRKLLV